MKLRRLLIDVNTQRDFLYPDGAWTVANRQAVMANLRKLMRVVRARRIPVVSCMDMHRPCEPSRSVPAHCVDGTTGQEKVPFTLMPRRVFVQADNTFNLPPNLTSRYRQLIFAKRGTDVLNNPKAERLLSAMKCEMLYVCGVALEHSVRAGVLGLLTRNKPVTVITDACGYFDNEQADMALRQMDAKGARLIGTAEFVDLLLADEARPRRLAEAVTSKSK